MRRHLSLRALAVLALALAAIVAAVTVLQERHEAARRGTAVTEARLHPGIVLLAKIVGGDVHEPAGLPVQNLFHYWVGAADLGAITRYGDHWYLALGDTLFALPQPQSADANFLVATAPYQPNAIAGMVFDGYLALHAVAGGIQVPARAIRPDPGYTIPGSLFTVQWHGRQYMFAQYMEGGDFGGNDHWSRDSRIAIYDDAQHIFRPYKPQVYRWLRRDRVASNANRLQYSFGQSAFWEDQAGGYLYMVGAPTNRFGGIKLARIPLATFLDPRDGRAWSYYLGNGAWSAPTADEMRIDRSVPWLIAPRDPAFSLDKDYTRARYPRGVSQCSYLTIAEFSVVWEPYLHSFLLLTSNAGCGPNPLRLYTAPTLTGPWTQRAEDVAVPSVVRGDAYAPYTTPSLLRDGGRTMYFLASTFSHYGIYLYRAQFGGAQALPGSRPAAATAGTMTR